MRNRWFLHRVAIFFGSMFVLARVTRAGADLPWLFYVLVPLAVSLIMSIWLYANRAGASTDLRSPFSLSGPFLPMQKHPVRFWLLHGSALASGGGLSLLLDWQEHSARIGLSMFFLLLGLFMLNGVIVVVRLIR